MNALLAIFRKELTDGFRDRRSLLSALLFPVSTAAVMWLLLRWVAGQRCV